MISNKESCWLPLANAHSALSIKSPLYPWRWYCCSPVAKPVTGKAEQLLWSSLLPGEGAVLSPHVGRMGWKACLLKGKVIQWACKLIVVGLQLTWVLLCFTVPVYTILAFLGMGQWKFTQITACWGCGCPCALWGVGLRVCKGPFQLKWFHSIKEHTLWPIFSLTY